MQESKFVPLKTYNRLTTALHICRLCQIQDGCLEDMYKFKILVQ